MKPAMTILGCVLAAALATAQSPSVIQKTRDTMNAVRDHSAAASNAALGIQEKTPPTAGTTHTTPSQPGGSAAVAKLPSAEGTTANSNKPSGSKTTAPERVRAPVTHPGPKPTSGEVLSKSNPPAVDPFAGNNASESGGEENPSGVEGAGPDKWASTGKRDPFISPVVSRPGGSGCSTGKKCLEIGTITLRGIVQSENGFIAVVSNGLNKAYFLRENDPVFNGYVMKITGDSIVFQETLQDRLGKSFTREVVKKITTPAV
jgi:type II secretory pathway pseudopilin PulG